MADFNDVVNQISGAVYQVAAIANQVNSIIHPGQASVGSPTMAPDQWRPSAAYVQTPQPVVAPQSASTGLRGIWDTILSFFRNLFHRNTTAATTVQSSGSWPAYNPDARAQLVAMFPIGSGNAMGIVPVAVNRTPNAIVANAGSFGQAAIATQNGEYFYYFKSEAPVRISQVTSQRAANGETQFAISLDNGKQLSAAIGPDGHTFSIQNHTLTLY